MNIKIIAEIGINHNGDIDLAKKMIDIAVEAKADIVKFQKRTIDKVYSQEALDSKRDSPWGSTNREQKMGLEFENKEYDIIDRYCKDNKIEWFASAWDMASIDFLSQYNCKYNKIASAMIIDDKFLNRIAMQKNIHLYLPECLLLKILKMQFRYLETLIVNLN